MKKQNFLVHVKIDVLFEAKIKAETIKEALQIAEGMTVEQIWKASSGVLDDSKIITAVFE